MNAAKFPIGGLFRFVAGTVRTLLPTYVLVFATLAAAGPLPRPTGPVILTVSGDIANTNAKGKAEFDRAMLEALGVSRLQTMTRWTQGEVVFEGVTAHKLIEAVQATGAIAHARAINDYRVDIPLSDFEDYPVLLALRKDGEDMRIRDKGPIWIVYPWDTYPELDTQEIKRRSVWQLSEIEIR